MLTASLAANSALAAAVVVLAVGGYRLYLLAYRDELTGLPNRRALLWELGKRQRLAGPYVVMLLDLDGFKTINDQHGHAAGDAVLREVAARLRTLPMFVARLGGDEFCVVARGSRREPETYADGLANQVRDAVAGAVLHARAWLHVGASIGATTSTGEPALTLLARADEAMYADKQSRRGDVGHHSPTQIRCARRRFRDHAYRSFHVVRGAA